MFKRFSNRQLLIFLGAVAALSLLLSLLGSGSGGTFDKNIATLDTAQVSRLLIAPAGNPPVELLRNGSQWQVKLPNGQMATTATGQVERALEQIALLEATQLASRKEADWAGFQVDSGGTRIQVFAGGEQRMDVILGKSEYGSSQMMTYVRLANTEETYLVSGFLAASFDRQADDWRDKTLLKGNAAEWSLISWNYPVDSSFQIGRTATGDWIQLPDSLPLDNAKVSSFLRSLGNLSGQAFAPQPSAAAQMDVSIQALTGLIQIQGFDTPNGRVLTSSENPGAYFADPTNSLSQKVFVGPAAFFPTEE